ncbi:hypothetical protein GCM10011611_48320 [Aliidongia dinghuensis]|uniref:Immunity protein 52 domain-containing protein n=1 Tax=Aliidongia dinghuensis TaxID=1867774 RepID=A0A8J3E5L7_9PROT|nr:Imm52 family immunity protein [Aliidongia dinghuensis]GGF36236.1 hypothetical protein GCM10011611_48320 [Aliidongia dinghuensis]
MTTKNFTARCSWGARADDPAKLAEYLRRNAEAFSALGPMLRSWWVADSLYEYDFVPLVHARHSLAAIVEHGVQCDDENEPEPLGGYRCTLANSPKASPTSVGLAMHGGVPKGERFFGNGCVLTTAYGVVPDPALIAYPLFKSMMMAMVKTWGASCATAFSNELSARWQRAKRDNEPVFDPSWMTYLSAPMLALVDPPEGVLCEPTPDGGLLMIAAEETFDANNPEHMAAAWAICDAVAPITMSEFFQW